MAIGFKLFRVRKDGTIGPLFINRRQRVPVGEWIESEYHPTKGFAHRAGWHMCTRPVAPHLKLTAERAWFMVEYDETSSRTYHRPECQGGDWILADKIKVLGPVAV